MVSKTQGGLRESFYNSMEREWGHTSKVQTLAFFMSFRSTAFLYSSIAWNYQSKDTSWLYDFGPSCVVRLGEDHIPSSNRFFPFCQITFPVFLSERNQPSMWSKKPTLSPPFLPLWVFCCPIIWYILSVFIINTKNSYLVMHFFLLRDDVDNSILAELKFIYINEFLFSTVVESCSH